MGTYGQQDYYIIAGPCIDVKDRSCVDVCPVDCIHDDGEEDRMLYIDPVECINCRACEAVCPVSATLPADDLPAEHKPFEEINWLWFQDKGAARAKVDALIPRSVA